MTNKSYTMNVEYDEELDEYVLPFPDELMTELNWKSGDTINWIDNKDGSWTLRKKEAKNA